MNGGRHTVRALSQEVWSVRTGGRKPSPLAGSPGNLRAAFGTGRRRLRFAHIDGSPAPSRVASHASGTPESGLRREATAADGAARPGSNGTAEPERQERAGTSPATQLNDGSPQEGS